MPSLAVTPFAVERWFGKYEFTTEINIAESCVQPMTPDELLELAGLGEAERRELLGRVRLGYTDSLGLPELREEVAALYPGTPADQVLITGGAIEANYLLARALTVPGEEFVCLHPVYQQLYQVAADLGARPVFWRLRWEDGFRPDLDELERLLEAHPGARRLVINFPHNPTGAVLSPDEMKRLADIVVRHGVGGGGLLVHADEVYRGLNLDPAAAPSPTIRQFLPDAVVTGSLSKAYGLPGLRIGWIVGPRPVIQKCWELRDYTSISVSALGETLAWQALAHREAVLARNRAIARRNLAVLSAFVEENSVFLEWVPPKEGVVAFPRLLPAALGLGRGPAAPGAGGDPSDRSVRTSRFRDSEDICRVLAEEHGVLLLPGTCFDEPLHFRLGFGYETDRLQTGLARLGAFFRGL